MNLQTLVDDLAEDLGRSVVINDAQYRPIVSSAQGEEIDELRARGLLGRATPPRERAYLESIHLSSAKRPQTVNLDRFGARERLAVPIRSRDALLGVLWLITGGLPPLTSSQFRAVDAAVEIAREYLAAAQDEIPGRSTRDMVLRGLLAPDPIVRRDALSTAVRAYGVSRSSATVVRAVAVGHDTSVVQRASLGRAVESLATATFMFMGEIGAALLFLERSHENTRTDDLIAATAARAGVPLRAIGSAYLTGTDIDVRPVAERAVATAAVAELLPDLGTSLRAEDVGPWLLIADVVSDPNRLQWYSPAAYALIHDADPLRRQTIETLLDHAHQIKVVCEELHIHRTTLYYRLENMPQVVKDAMDDGMKRSALHLGLKLASYWENAGHIQ
ncbi:helix-turn-helix domain-containing protein [Microbacterium sp. NPDC006705]